MIMLQNVFEMKDNGLQMTPVHSGSCLMCVLYTQAVVKSSIRAGEQTQERFLSAAHTLDTYGPNTLQANTSDTRA